MEDKIEIGAKPKVKKPDAQAPVESLDDGLLQIGEDGLGSAKVGRRQVKMKELSGLESMYVTELLPPNASEQVTNMYKAFAAVREIDGVPYPMVRQKEELHQVAARFNDRETQELIGRYLLTWFFTPEEREKLKNL